MSAVQHLYSELTALYLLHPCKIFRVVVVLVNKYCTLMLVSSIVLITNFKNVFAFVKFHYKMPFVSSDEDLSFRDSGPLF